MWRKIFRWLFILLAIFLLSSVGTVIVYRWVMPPVTPLMLTRALTTGHGMAYRHTSVPLSAIDARMPCAVVASEDNLFLRHHGFDWQQIRLALRESREGKRSRGASTISQQCAKNVFLFPAHSYLRKGLEAYFTVLIEHLWGKRRIMEVYLNVIEFGDGVYGVEAAAQAFFGHSARHLTRHEAALLAAVLPAPRRMHPDHPSRYVHRRAAHIEYLMKCIGPVKWD